MSLVRSFLATFCSWLGGVAVAHLHFCRSSGGPCYDWCFSLVPDRKPPEKFLPWYIRTAVI